MVSLGHLLVDRRSSDAAANGTALHVQRLVSPATLFAYVSGFFRSFCHYKLLNRYHMRLLEEFFCSGVENFLILWGLESNISIYAAVPERWGNCIPPCLSSSLLCWPHLSSFRKHSENAALRKAESLGVTRIAATKVSAILF